MLNNKIQAKCICFILENMIYMNKKHKDLDKGLWKMYSITIFTIIFKQGFVLIIPPCLEDDKRPTWVKGMIPEFGIGFADACFRIRYSIRIWKSRRDLVSDRTE